MQDYVAPLSATGSWGGTYFAHPFNNDNLNANGGFNNSIKFASANYSGFTFGGTYGFSNQTNFANNRQYSLGAAYQFQGLRVAAAYAQQNNPGASTVGATDAGNAPLLSALNAALGNFRAREFGAGVGYLFGPASFGLVWTQSRQDNFAASTVGSLRFNNYEFNASYNVTAALRVGVAYTFSDGRLYDSQAGNDAIRYHQVGLQTNYALSKRTDAYAQVVYQRTAGDSGVGPSIYNGTNTGFSSSRNQSAVSVGIRHKF
jgi:predicted porin